MAVPSTAGATGMDEMLKQLKKAIGGDEADMDQQNVTAASLERLSESWAHRTEAGRLGEYFNYDAFQPNVQVPFAGFAEHVDTQCVNINNDAHTVTFSFNQSDFMDLHNTFMELKLKVPQFLRGATRRNLYHNKAGHARHTYIQVNPENDNWNEYIFWKDGGPIKLIDSIEVQWMTGNNTSAFARTSAFGDMMVVGWKTGICNQKGWEDVRRFFFPMRCDDFPKRHWRDFLVWKCSSGANPHPSLIPNEDYTEVTVHFPLVMCLPGWNGMGSNYWPIDSVFNVVIKLRPWIAAVYFYNPGTHNVSADGADGSADDNAHRFVYQLNKMEDEVDYLTKPPSDSIAEPDDRPSTSAYLNAMNLGGDRNREIPSILSARTFFRTIKLAGTLPSAIPMSLTSPANYFFNLDSSFPSLNPDLLDYQIPNHADKDITLISTMNPTYPQMLIIWFYATGDGVMASDSNTNWFQRNEYSASMILSPISPRMNPSLLLSIDEITISYKTNEMEAGSVLIWNWKRSDDPEFEMMYWRYQQNMKRMNEGVQFTMSKERWLKEPYILVPTTMEGFADWNTALCSNGSVSIRVRRNNTQDKIIRIGYLEWVRSITTINNQYALTNATLVTTKGGISRGAF